MYAHGLGYTIQIVAIPVTDMADLVDEECLVHYPSSNISREPTRLLTQHQLNTILTRAKQWIEGDKQPEKDIAENLITTNINCEHPHYSHHNCYLMFSSLSKLTRAQNSKRKVSLFVLL